MPLSKLRALSREAASKRADIVPIANLWDDLINGRARSVDTFDEGDCCYVILRVSGETELRPLSRMIDALRPILLGTMQKTIAIDQRRAASTITTLASACMKRMGFDGKATRPPPILAMAAHASVTNSPIPSYAASFQIHSSTFRIVWATRPEPPASSGLSRAELDVMDRLLAGLTTREIAVLRRRSARTVTNQVASIYRKLRVGNRTGLVNRLIVNSTPRGGTLAA
jgi:DNA-binding CsgD family transcriptional regulator